MFLKIELNGMNNIVMGDQHSLLRLEPVLKAKQEQLDALNSEVTEKEKYVLLINISFHIRIKLLNHTYNF